MSVPPTARTPSSEAPSMTEQSKQDRELHSERRGRAIKSAVFTSLASKAGTALLQLVSIPIAYRVLGAEAFGLYATVAMAIGIVILLQFGVGPALTHGISRATAIDDPGLARCYFSTSWFLMLGLAILGGLVFSLLLLYVPLTFFFGAKYAGLEPQLLPALWLALGIILLEFLLSHTERAREGFLEVHINNAWGAAGNFLGGIAVGAGIWFFPSIEFLILAVYGSHVFAKGANTIHLLVKRPELLPRPSVCSGKVAGELLSDGLAFSVSHSLSTILEVNVCSLIIAHFAGPAAVGTFMVLMQVASFMLGFVIMFTTPTWPSIVDAYTRRDFPWIRRIAKRLWAYVLSYGLCASLGLTLLGPYLLPLWMGPEFQVDWTILLPFSLFYLSASWGHTNHSMLVGLGLVKRSAVYALLEAVVILGPAYIGMATFGLSGLFTGMFLTMVCLTGWIFPCMLLRKLKEGTEDGIPETVSAPSR
jgi:O-antigen/teichoic acid export membrane protein